MITYSTLSRRSITGISALLLSVVVHAQAIGDTFTEGGFQCEVLAVNPETASGQVKITGSATEVGESLEIPATLKHTYAEAEWLFDVTVIGEKAFAESKALKTVRFPSPEETSITVIGPLAFHHCAALQCINLEDTKIEVLEPLFTKDETDEMYFEDLTELQLPETLKEIKSFAMQFLGIRTMTIPASVTTIGEGILEGNIYLEEFYWKGAQVDRLPLYTFLGDDALQKVYFLTVNDIATDGLTDMHFYMCHKELLTVYVTPASYEILSANGYNNETSVFSTLAVDPNWTGIVMPQAASSGSVRGVTDKYHAVYSISGSKISQPQKGTLYIRDGRKFIAR